MTKRSDDEVTEERVAGALGKLGADKEPPPGWEQRVRDVVGGRIEQMPEVYRTRVRAKLEHRLNRLFRLLADRAPDALIAAEVVLIGELGAAIDPHGTARRAGEDAERSARDLVRLCRSLGCEHDADDEECESVIHLDNFNDHHCAAHAAKLRAELPEHAGTYDPGAPEDVTS